MALKVKHKTIEDIANMGMEKALKKHASGEGDEEFNEAISRYYSKRRIDEAKKKHGSEKSEPKEVKAPDYVKTSAGKEGPPSNSSSHVIENYTPGVRNAAARRTGGRQGQGMTPSSKKPGKISTIPPKSVDSQIKALERALAAAKKKGGRTGFLKTASIQRKISDLKGKK